MLLGRFSFSDHCIKQYRIRANMRNASATQIKQCIKRDLRTLNIRRIIHVGEDVHIFTGGYKEFIFIKTGGSFVLKTFIKRNRDDNMDRINKRKNLVTN
jgi:hypothetical protein